MQKRFILLILILIAIISGISFFSLFFYFDPYSNIALGTSLLGVSFFLFVTGFLGVIFYLIKKIYFLGDVHLYNVVSSIRQASFVAIYIIVITASESIGTPTATIGLATFFMLVFLELFIRSL